MIVSAVLAGTFLFGTVYAQTATTPAPAKQDAKKEASTQKKETATQEKDKSGKKKGEKHSSAKTETKAPAVK